MAYACQYRGSYVPVTRWTSGRKVAFEVANLPGVITVTHPSTAIKYNLLLHGTADTDHKANSTSVYIGVEHSPGVVVSLNEGEAQHKPQFLQWGCLV